MSKAIEAPEGPSWAARLDLLIFAINCAAAIFFGLWLGHISHDRSEPEVPTYFVQKVFVCAPPAKPNCDATEIWSDYQRERAEVWHRPGV